MSNLSHRQLNLRSTTIFREYMMSKNSVKYTFLLEAYESHKWSRGYRDFDMNFSFFSHFDVIIMSITMWYLISQKEVEPWLVYFLNIVTINVDYTFKACKINVIFLNLLLASEYSFCYFFDIIYILSAA